MKADLDVFTARDLRTRSSELIRDAERGQYGLITKHGRPAALAIPFDRRLVELGVAADMALGLFERRLVTMAKAARLAGLTLDAFMALLAQTGLDAVDYPAEEMAREMEVPL